MKVDGVVYCDLCNGSITGDAWARVREKIVCSECIESLNITPSLAVGRSDSDTKAQSGAGIGNVTLKAAGASRTESTFLALGWVCVVAGGVAGAIFGGSIGFAFTVGGEHYAGVAVFGVLAGLLGGLLAGALIGMPYFAVGLMLGYLRQILNELRTR